MRRFIRTPDTRDRGVALVAAVAVAIIGVAITVLVVTQVIVATNDSARDRIRTLEVHSAESGLDAMMSELATDAPCPGPSWSPVTVGEGATATIVEVTVKYWAGSTALTCTAGVLSDVPDKAVVTSTSRSAHSVAGSVDPERKFEATVNLIPLSSVIPGAALFAGGGISTGAGFSVEVTDGSDAASVWVDNGDYLCDTNVKIGGNLYVVRGSATMNSGCVVDGDLWARTGYTDNTGMTAPNWRVLGNTTVYSGTFKLANPSRFRGDLSVGGNINPNPADTYQPQWKNSTVGGVACANNLPTHCTNITEYEYAGLPKVEFIIGDWQPAEDGTNFQLKYKDYFAQAAAKSWGIDTLPDGHWQKNETLNNPCQPPAHRYTAPVKLPFPGSTTPTVFDMRDCNPFNPNGGMFRMELYADVALFVTSFNSSNGINVKSGDGKAHRLWIIAPWAAGIDGMTAKNITINGNTFSYKPGSINASQGGYQIDSSISLFMYTPHELKFPNTSTTYGQLYAGKVTVGSGNGKFYYSPVGVPGVNLTIPTTSASGFKVEIVNKHELRN